jgi:hypothetical protein
MNQTFNLKRFSLLFVKHTADNYKTYLMAFLVLMGMLILTLGLTAYLDEGEVRLAIQMVVFTFFFIVAGCIFTSIIFSDFGNKKKATSILTLPASHFEKFLVGWIYSYVVFQLLFVLAFYLIAMLMQQLSPLKSGTYIQQLGIFSYGDHIYTDFAVYHAIVLCGSIFFEKLHFIKTAFVLLIGALIISYLNFEFIQVFISETVISAWPFQEITVTDKFNTWLPGPDGKYSSSMVLSSEGSNLFFLPSEGSSRIVMFKYDTHILIMTLIVVCILWVSSFYRLKEKEV